LAKTPVNIRWSAPVYVAAFLWSLSVWAGVPRGVEISAVSISSESFAPAHGQTILIKYSLSKSSTVNIDIYDPDFHLIRNLASNIENGEGNNEIEWDGTDIDGNVVPDEAYFFTIVARDRKGYESVYDPTTFSGGEQFDITEADINRSMNTITYRIEKPSRMLIRIGISGGALLNSPVNWKPRISGEITEYWMGKDQDDVIDLRDHERMKMVITGFYLVENSIITYGNKKENYYTYKVRLADKRTKKEPRVSSPRGSHVVISSHYLRTRMLDRLIDVALQFPQNDSDSDPMVAISSQTELVRVDLSERDKIDLIDEPFEISFFLDGEYYSEQEIGYTPYNWMWDLENVEKGEHILTVNVSSFRDIIGIKSRRIWILN
jgi:hypothetical protein